MIQEVTRGDAMRAPAVYPPGWQHVQPIPGQDGSMIIRDFPSLGLRVSISDDTYPPGDGPGHQGGRVRHAVISRMADDRYPGWDEMRDWLRTSGFFDRSRDIVMVLPPDADYVNVRHTAFHWFQRMLP